MTTMRRVKRSGRNPSTGAKTVRISIMNRRTKRDGRNPSTGVRNPTTTDRTGRNPSNG
jgi:nucleoid DNA-binding protein